MYSRRLHPPRLSRRVLLVLPTGTLFPPTVHGTETVPHVRHFMRFLAPPTPMGVQLELQLAEDGSARVHGVVQLPEADPPLVLVAIPDSAEVRFADRGDGTAGLVELKAQFHPPSGDKGFGFILDTDGVDIAASGRYPVVLHLEGTTVTATMEVHLAPDQATGKLATPGQAKRSQAGTRHRKRRR